LKLSTKIQSPFSSRTKARRELQVCSFESLELEVYNGRSELESNIDREN